MPRWGRARAGHGILSIGNSSAGRKRWFVAVGALAAVHVFATPWAAAECGHDASGFAAWLARFKSKAAAEGISTAAISSALAGVTYDPRVIHLDRSQRSFKLNFAEFYARRVDSALIRRGLSL